MTGADLFPAGLLQGTHAVLPGAPGEIAGGFAPDDEVVQLGTGFEDFKQADAAAKTGLAAAVATDRDGQVGDPVRLGLIQAEDGERVAEFGRLDRGRAGAVFAETSHKALGDDQLDRRGDQEGLDAHVDQSRDRPRGVVGVKGGEDEVARERGADGDVRRLAVADLADHDDIGVLPQDVPQGTGEGQADLGPDLDLVGAGHLVFDGVFDRDDAEVGGVDLTEKGVERGGFAGAGRTGHQNDAMGELEDALDGGLLGGIHAQPVHGVGLAAEVEQAQAHALGVDGRDGGDADVERIAPGLEVDAPVLRQAFFRDVEPRHDLEARDDGILVAD